MLKTSGCLFHASVIFTGYIWIKFNLPRGNVRQYLLHFLNHYVFASSYFFFFWRNEKRKNSPIPEKLRGTVGAIGKNSRDEKNLFLDCPCVSCSTTVRQRSLKIFTVFFPAY